MCASVPNCYLCAALYCLYGYRVELSAALREWMLVSGLAVSDCLDLGMPL